MLPGALLYNTSLTDTLGTLGCSEDTFIAIVLGTELTSSMSGVEGVETEETPLSSRVEIGVGPAGELQEWTVQERALV